MDQPLRILIVDADPFYRRGMREILNDRPELRVVGEAGDAEQAALRAGELRPLGLDLVLMELDLPDGQGLAVLERLARAEPDLAIVVLTGPDSPPSQVQAVFRAGAVGYLTKSLPPEGLVNALLGYARGESLPITPVVAPLLLSLLRVDQAAESSPAPATLTRREQEVFELIASGARDRDIAQRLVVSESTIKKHVQNILRKLHARNRAQAIARLRSG